MWNDNARTLERDRLMRDVQEHLPVAYCAHCGAELYENDECYMIGDLVYCNDCVWPCEAWEAVE